MDRQGVLGRSGAVVGYVAGSGEAVTGSINNGIYPRDRRHFPGTGLVQLDVGGEAEFRHWCELVQRVASSAGYVGSRECELGELARLVSSQAEYLGFALGHYHLGLEKKLLEILHQMMRSGLIHLRGENGRAKFSLCKM